jgi:hemerythrin-like domain-containing protein
MTEPASPAALDLLSRTGWPDELTLLLRQYPRPTWDDNPNIAGMARFWLDIHASFRRAGTALNASASEFREGLLTPERFRAWYAPRIQTFLNHLNGHHQIEDYQMFPLFGVAEPRLLRGFDVLEADHEVIHAAMDRVADTANAFMQTDAADRDKMRFAADDYAAAGDALLAMLDRHLGDEEDLVIPLILDRGDEGLGL